MRKVKKSLSEASDDEIANAVLRIVDVYKSGSRKSEWESLQRKDRSLPGWEQAVELAVKKGYLKRNRRGAVSKAPKGHKATGTRHGGEAAARRSLARQAIADK